MVHRLLCLLSIFLFSKGDGENGRLPRSNRGQNGVQLLQIRRSPGNFRGTNSQPQQHGNYNLLTFCLSFYTRTHKINRSVTSLLLQLQMMVFAFTKLYTQCYGKWSCKDLYIFINRLLFFVCLFAV